MKTSIGSVVPALVPPTTSSLAHSSHEQEHDDAKQGSCWSNSGLAVLAFTQNSRSQKDGPKSVRVLLSDNLRHHAEFSPRH